MLKKKTAALFIAVIITMTVSLVSIAYAQEPTQSEEGRTLLYVVGAWLVYSVVGLLPSLVSGEQFDAYKFTRSFIWAVVVAVIAIGLGIHPTVVEAQYTNLVTEVVNFIGNSGFGLSLIYFFDKLYRTVTGLAGKLQKAAASAPK